MGLCGERREEWVIKISGERRREEERKKVNQIGLWTALCRDVTTITIMIAVKIL